MVLYHSKTQRHVINTCTVQSLYNTHFYNMEPDTTQFFVPWNFTKELKETDHVKLKLTHSLRTINFALFVNIPAFIIITKLLLIHSPIKSLHSRYFFMLFDLGPICLQSYEQTTLVGSGY